jgi:hypothetical protein
MQPTSTNPLAKHFRQPAIYLSLPSEGKYWEDGSLDLPMNGQIAVYPMTTRDEIMIRTPDALLNGESMIAVIQSCCPQIKDAWKMPSIDVDAVLVAIRIASYGQDMDIDSKCPNEACLHESTHSLDLTGILDVIRAPNYNKKVMVDGLKIKLKPQSYFEGNKTNLLNFEEQRLLGVISTEDLPGDQKLKQFHEHMGRMVSLNLDIITAGTESIEIDDGTIVTDPNFIKEFYDNAGNKVITAVRKQFEEFAETAALPKPKVKCEECETEYPVEITFDYTRFFAVAS